MLPAILYLILFLSLLASLIPWMFSRSGKVREDRTDEIPDGEACWSGWEIDEPIGATPRALVGEGE
jgi:hypothetical protein